MTKNRAGFATDYMCSACQKTLINFPSDLLINGSGPISTFCKDVSRGGPK